MPKPVFINNFAELINYYNSKKIGEPISLADTDKLRNDEARIAYFVRVLASAHKSSFDFTAVKDVFIYDAALDAINKLFNDNRSIIERLNTHIKATAQSPELNQQFQQLYNKFISRGMSKTLMSNLTELEQKVKPAAPVRSTTQDMFQHLGVKSAPEKMMASPEKQVVSQRAKPRQASETAKQERESIFSLKNKSDGNRSVEKYYVSAAYFAPLGDGMFEAKGNSTNREIKKGQTYTHNEVRDLIRDRLEMTSPPPALGAERLGNRRPGRSS